VLDPDEGFLFGEGVVGAGSWEVEGFSHSFDAVPDRDAQSLLGSRTGLDLLSGNRSSWVFVKVKLLALFGY